MKDINDMTPEELRALADQKEQEMDSPIKEGYAKEDIYMAKDSFSISYDVGIGTRKELEEKLKFEDIFDLVSPKGTRFVRWPDDGDDPGWADEYEGYFVCMDDKWAEKYLEGVRNLDE